MNIKAMRCEKSRKQLHTHLEKYVHFSGAHVSTVVTFHLNTAASKHGEHATPRGLYRKEQYIIRNVVRACRSVLEIPVTVAADE
jgi:hypothetical protein